MRAKPQEVDLTGLEQWYETEEFLYASSSRERKRLVCTLKGTLKVTVCGETVWQGTQPFAAVEKYNSITEKYIENKEPFIL